MSKDFSSDHSARMAALRAARTLERVVGATFGPRGGTVVVPDVHGGCPRVTRDGATVARNLELEDPSENVIVQVLRDGADRSARETGDGTTTTLLLAAGVIRAGIKWTAAGQDSGTLSRAVRRASRRMLQSLRSLSRSLRGDAELQRVAAMAAGGDGALGALLARALLSVGWDGDVVLDVETGAETELRIVDGFRLPVSPLAMDHVSLSANELRDADLLVHDGTLHPDTSMPPFIDRARRDGRALVVIARSLGDGVVSPLIAAQGAEGPAILLARVDVGDEHVPEMLGDLALFTGAAVRMDAAGQGWPRGLDDLGRARVVRVEGSELRLVGGSGSAEAVRARIDSLRARLDGTDEESRRALRERAGRLAGRSAVLRLGAATEPEHQDVSSRADGALCTARAALEDGVVPGGGIALLRSAQEAKRERPDDIGAQVLRDAVEALVSRLAANAGAEGRAVLERVRAATGPVGFHAVTGRIEDLDAAGVLDPLKVVGSALEHGVSVACAILEAGGLLTEHRPGAEPDGEADGPTRRSSRAARDRRDPR